MNEEETIFVDAESEYNTQKVNSFKEIVMNHLAKISNIATKEFRPGYWKKKPVSTGGGMYLAETYEEDTREAYVNAIDFLYDVLLPKFDKDCITETDKLIKKLDEDKQNFKDNKDGWVDEKLMTRRKIFQQLSLLLKRLKYLETGAIID